MTELFSSLPLEVKARWNTLFGNPVGDRKYMVQPRDITPERFDGIDPSRSLSETEVLDLLARFGEHAVGIPGIEGVAFLGAGPPLFPESGLIVEIMTPPNTKNGRLLDDLLPAWSNVSHNLRNNRIHNSMGWVNVAPGGLETVEPDIRKRWKQEKLMLFALLVPQRSQ